MAVIGESGGLEESLRRVAGDHKEELEGRGLPNGSPSALMICAAAMGCIGMIRKMAVLNKVRFETGRASVSGSVLWASFHVFCLCTDNPHVKHLETTWAASHVLPMLNSAASSL